MRMVLGSLVFAIAIALAIAIQGAGQLAEAATPGTIDDGGTEPGHPSHDPGPAAEADPRPTSAPILGDAEPAPGPVPSAGPVGKTDEHDRGLRHRIALAPRFAYRLGDAGRAVTPAPGFGLAGTYEFRYARVGRVLELGLGVDFAFDRFATGERGTCSGAFLGRQECIANTEGSFSATRVISETSFVLTHTIAARAGRLRPYLMLGAGIGVGFFDSVQTDLQPGTARDVHVLGRAAVGLDVLLVSAWSVTVRADYTAVRAASPFTIGAGQTLPLFGDLLDVGIGFAYGF